MPSPARLAPPGEVPTRMGTYQELGECSIRRLLWPPVSRQPLCRCDLVGGHAVRNCVTCLIRSLSLLLCPLCSGHVEPKMGLHEVLWNALPFCVHLADLHLCITKPLLRSVREQLGSHLEILRYPMSISVHR